MNDIKKIVRKSASSFFWTMYLLPKAKRQAIYTIYALCRHIDDVINGNASEKEKISLISAWRQEIDNIYDKKVPATEIGRKIYKNCMRFKLPKEEFIKLIDAASLSINLQAPTLNELEEYCRGIAGSPSILGLMIFGINNENLAINLGNAIQFTNILRDVKEDAVNGRLYIAKEFLLKAEITSTDPMLVLVDPNFSIARGEMAKLADKYFEQIYEILDTLDKKTIRPILMIINIYKRYFDIMNTRGWEIISPKPKIGRLDRFKIMVKAFLK